MKNGRPSTIEEEIEEGKRLAREASAVRARNQPGLKRYTQKPAAKVSPRQPRRKQH